jgi:hypothetical protein
MASNGATAPTGLEPAVASAESIAALEQKLVQKNEVVAELLEEHVQLKK